MQPREASAPQATQGFSITEVLLPAPESNGGQPDDASPACAEQSSGLLSVKGKDRLPALTAPFKPLVEHKAEMVKSAVVKSAGVNPAGVDPAGGQSPVNL